jgi:protein-disulfide isomerase
MPTGDAKVRLLKFNDYQCPSCRQAWILYQSIIAKYEASHPGVFEYESRDFPLEAECGAGGVHGAACEAAAAVRMAREKNMGKELEAALFDRQSPSMTREEVKSALAEVAQISGEDFDARYDAMLEAVRADVQLGQRLEVSGTPTFFLNGIRLAGGLRRGDCLRAAEGRSGLLTAVWTSSGPKALPSTTRGVSGDRVPISRSKT